MILMSFVIIIVSFVIIIVSFFIALWFVYRAFKHTHVIISSCIYVEVFQLVNIETLSIIRYDIEFLKKADFENYGLINFKSFLLYILYCINENYSEKLKYYLIQKNSF